MLPAVIGQFHQQRATLAELRQWSNPNDSWRLKQEIDISVGQMSDPEFDERADYELLFLES